MPASMVPQKATPQPPQEALQQAPQEAQAATSLLETAVFLHKQGLALVPIRPGTKEPHTDVLKALYGDTAWGHLARRRASIPEVAAWFEHDPDCQLGVIAGPASGNIAFVDFDDLDAAWGMVKALHNLGGPVMVTPRPGFRYVLRQREPIPSRKLTLPDGRVVGEVLTGYNAAGKPIAQYVVVPPSVHPSGKRYFWMSPQRGPSAPTPELSAAELEALLTAVSTTQAAASLTADADTVTHVPRREPPSGRPVSKSEYSDLLTLPGEAGHTVAALLRQPAFVEGALRVLGLEGVRVGQAFRCILPGHDERRPSAALFRLDDGSVLYHDFHGRDGDEWFTLPEVYAAIKTGHVRRLRGRPEHVVWTWRLAIEAGVIEPAKVEAPEPPADLKPAERKVYEGFLLLLGCKWLYEPGAPTVFSWRFAAAWCGVSERHVGAAMAGLLRRGLIRRVGEHQPARGRPQALFLPGLVAYAGGVKDADKPARRPWARKAVKNVLRAARAQKDKPAEPCAKCGGTRFWRLYARKKGEYPQWVCESCLPAPHGAVEWCEVSTPPPS